MLSLDNRCCHLIIDVIRCKDQKENLQIIDEICSCLLKNFAFIIDKFIDYLYIVSHKCFLSVVNVPCFYYLYKKCIYIVSHKCFFFSVVNVPCFYQLSTTGFCYLDIHHEEILTAGMSMSRLP